jgi:hypothetical protein
MRQLQSLDAWRAGQDLAEQAYVLTVRPALHRHFALIDAAELGSHLEILRRLKLIEEPAVSEAAALCTRVISMLVGLLRKIGPRSSSRFPFPVSRFPIKTHAPESSS